MRDGCVEDGCPVGSLLARSRLQMKDWGDGEERPSVGLKIEFFVLSFAWGMAILATILTFVGPTPNGAHSGGVAADGCHGDRVNGDRHCDHDTSAIQPVASKINGSVYYPSCAAARGAGAAPVYRGQPGYGLHLDTDNDGKACE
jgi:Excalibur calcium-binding domain